MVGATAGSGPDWLGACRPRGCRTNPTKELACSSVVHRKGSPAPQSHKRPDPGTASAGMHNLLGEFLHHRANFSTTALPSAFPVPARIEEVDKQLHGRLAAHVNDLHEADDVCREPRAVELVVSHVQVTAEEGGGAGN